jgi:hypothetical protein
MSNPFSTVLRPQPLCLMFPERLLLRLTLARVDFYFPRSIRTNFPEPKDPLLKKGFITAEEEFPPDSILRITPAGEAHTFATIIDSKHHAKAREEIEYFAKRIESNLAYYREIHGHLKGTDQ